MIAHATPASRASGVLLPSHVQAAWIKRPTRLYLAFYPGSLPVMQTFARLLQLAGLTVPPITILAQLSESITAGQMLGFLIASVCMFSLGYLLQRVASGR